MSDEIFVYLLDETYKFIVGDFLDRMLEYTVSALNTRRNEMNKGYGEWEETDFKKWATEMYRAWLAGGEEALAAAIEKRDKTEGEK